VINGNVVVPPPGCQLIGTRVNGSVTVLPTATLTTSANAVITGNLTCSTQSTCTLSATTIGGDVVAKAGISFLAETSKISGDFTCADQQCTLSSVSVGDNVTLLAGPGILDIFGSTMDDLWCFGYACNVYGDAATYTLPTTIRSLVTVGPGSALSTAMARIGSHSAEIGGNLLCLKCTSIDISDTIVTGNVQTIGAAWNHFCEDTIHGSMLVSLNTFIFTSCAGNTIDGTLTLLANKGVIGIFNNQIGGSLLLIGNRADEIGLVGNRVTKDIICLNSKPTPIGAANTARRIDPACGPIGVPLGV
jgi:hypothetical protein